MTAASATTRAWLEPHPASVGAARRLVSDLLRQAGREDLVETARLVVSEVVTNAVVHAATPVALSVDLSQGFLRVEVADGSVHLPRLRDYEDLAGTGRGLRLVAKMVDRWGVQQREDGKALWFEVGVNPSVTQAATEAMTLAMSGPVRRPGNEEPAVGEEPASFPCVLLDVPLLLHAAWQQHAESLLREYLLVRIQEGDAVTEIEAHAAISDAMTVLREQVPFPDVGDDPASVMAHAVEPRISAPRLDIEIPWTSLSHFRLLEQTLDAALLLADAGELLAPATQPEIQSLRRWLCAEVLGQSRGAPPRSWATWPQQAGSPADAVPAGDLLGVAGSPDTLVAADDTGQVVAVSVAAAALLGWQPERLTGRRLVDIVPDRYRQAHLAGFTMHLFAGRSLLIDTPVVVPVLHHDGHEVLVNLLVTSRAAGAGRYHFVARVWPVE